MKRSKCKNPCLPAGKLHIELSSRPALEASLEDPYTAGLEFVYKKVEFKNRLFYDGFNILNFILSF